MEEKEKTIIDLKCPVCGREDKIEWDSPMIPLPIVQELASQQGWILNKEYGKVYVPFCKEHEPKGLYYFKNVKKLVFEELKLPVKS
jgi:hypothetical protein